jgi:AbrB family looped-hinge helix DNA binding protein
MASPSSADTTPHPLVRLDGWLQVDGSLRLAAGASGWYAWNVRTRVTKRGQVSIPAVVRRKLGISASTRLEWVIEGNAARVIPIPDDPVGALRGSGKAGSVARLLKDRRRDRDRDGR